ncbi:uncharacterized protein LOC100846611 isoform X2 [Brachypodium distachyon]|uniref:Uncharacterized protein n=1 Tax=Brachypodium distachyon TaxID=15368 RepID=I1IEM2_BRADI|nr:uncharacterized protein LOC100846611 isoform X2 [Brachypodium distachyon]KQK01645.1 hypothetical protein BRADI_3g57300v3 [Brachypodium distachyon]|eukprot:XP_003570524.1 uncharacterized protein LOC100846611 isoform X2 [Brachypodium distachyon]
MEVGAPQDARENKNEENEFEENGSSDPVVYQLVRVEGDGTLVPATEDEVLQFEHFVDEKVDLPSIEDVGRVEDFFANNCMFLKPDLEEGPCKLETTGKLQTQKLDADLEEDRLKPLDDSLDIPSKCTVVHDKQPEKLNTEQGYHNTVHLDNASTETTKSTVLNDSCSVEKEKADACSRHVNDSSTEPSVSGITSSVPDFSILRGEVFLDTLTIRELQEAFRATFGRQTTVKDKLWLKRRITMGLTHSCDVPSSGCVIKDYIVVGKDAKEELPTIEGILKVEVEATSLARDQVLDHANERDTPSSSYYQSEDQQRSSKRLKGISTDNDESLGTLQDEQGTAKRLRKPTKRYIEELSDIETFDSTGKLSSPGKRPAHDEVLLRPRATFQEVDSLTITYPTRKDTFGGFSVHVPYVSRMRRGRPRRNFSSFLDDKPSVECAEVQMAVEMTVEKDGEQGNHVNQAMEVPLMNNAEKNGGHVETADNKEVRTVEANILCRADAKSKTKRSLKRKHHRAWTLSEVLKLVDGVARFGVGKWSEIRRLAFASYSYRTSVDLKDKWRNLIRASQTQLYLEKDGSCLRKSNPSTIPIPPSILLRVKELAEMQPQVGDLAAPMQLNSRAAQGKGSGFL